MPSLNSQCSLTRTLAVDAHASGTTAKPHSHLLFSWSHAAGRPQRPPLLWETTACKREVQKGLTRSAGILGIDITLPRLQGDPTTSDTSVQPQLWRRSLYCRLQSPEARAYLLKVQKEPHRISIRSPEYDMCMCIYIYIFVRVCCITYTHANIHIYMHVHIHNMS